MVHHQTNTTSMENTMTLPEYELAVTCDHGVTIAACGTDECSNILLSREREHAEARMGHAAETGEYDG